MKSYDIAIIGAGPTGIGIAKALNESRLDYIVFDREKDIGGIPLSCHHLSFGFNLYKHPVSGPHFIKKLTNNMDMSRFVMDTHVIGFDDRHIHIRNKHTQDTIKANKIVMATGCREKPRHARLVSGLRPYEILTTGSLQKVMDQTAIRPFKKPVIVGSELVSFSALLTCLGKRNKVAAMIELNHKISTYGFAKLLLIALRIPLRCAANIVKIHGVRHVEAITIEHHGKFETIECDGIIFTGQFIGEDSLLNYNPLDFSLKSSIKLDQYGRLDGYPNIFLAGNLIHPGDRGDLCFMEGYQLGQYLISLKEENVRSDFDVDIDFDPAITAHIQKIAFKKGYTDKITLYGRLKTHHQGKIVVYAGNSKIFSKSGNFKPYTRIRLKDIDLSHHFAILEKEKIISLRLE